MATVLANGSLSSNTSGEGDIRKNFITNDLVECIVALPKQLFYNTGIPACIWFLRREKKGRDNLSGRPHEVLFIDASEMGFMKDRVHRELSEEDMDKITTTYHTWRKGSTYEDQKWFCKSATLQDIEKHNFVLTPWRYVWIVDAIDDGVPFEEKMKKLTDQLREQMDKEQKMNEEIKKQLAKIGFSL